MFFMREAAVAKYARDRILMLINMLRNALSEENYAICTNWPTV